MLGIEIIRTSLVFLCVVPSALSVYFRSAFVRGYHQPFIARSVITRPAIAPRSIIATPRLQRLYEAKKKAQVIEKQIDSEIEQILQNQIYRRNFDNSDYDPDSNLFSLKPTNSFSAQIGAQGGAWFPGPAGAGIEGSQMLEGEANQGGFRRMQHAKAPSQLWSERMFQGQTNAGASQSAETKGIPRGLSPTVTQSTPDPSEEMDRLGNPREFDKKCAVLKLTFEKNSGRLVYDDSPQKNNMQLEDGATLLKDEMETGRSVDLGENGKIVLKSVFKGKPKKSVAVSMWVKLNGIKGSIPLLTATDEHNFVRYDLLLQDGKGVWLHRADSGRNLFRVESSSSDITAGQWHNIVGTYDSMSKTASLWVDGKQVSNQEGINGSLSQRWNKLTVFGGKNTHGYMDNIFMFRCPLDKTKIVALYVSAASPRNVKKNFIPK